MKHVQKYAEQVSRYLVVSEKSLTLLQALRAEAMMGGSGTKSMAQRSPIPWR